jgi:NAD(P) transhydrogenase
VIACEYASIFAALGTQVTMVDKGARPVSFMEEELTDRFLAHFMRRTGQFLAGRQAKRVEWDGVAAVGDRARRRHAAAQREGAVRARPHGEPVAPRHRGRRPQDQRARVHLRRRALPHRHRAHLRRRRRDRAARARGDRHGAGPARDPHVFGLPADSTSRTTPVGIYTIPEMACVGLTEEAARAKHG